jgi:hypothetical protein
VTFVLLGGHPTGEDLERGTNRHGRRVSKWNAHVDEACGRAKVAFFPTVAVEA